MILARSRPLAPGSREGHFCSATLSMIPKKPALDLIGGGDRISEKIMREQKARQASW
jgi:hypothetical protein